jgi:hypothetical protein
MMRRAGRVLGVRWGSAFLIVLLIGISIQQITSSVRHRHLSEQTRSAVATIGASHGIIVPRAIDDLDELPREMVCAELRGRFAESPPRQKLPLAFALAHFNDVKTDFLVSQVPTASPDETDNFVTALSHARNAAVVALEAKARAIGNDYRTKARLAILALHLESPSLAIAMCQPSTDPIQRSLFIDECWSWHGEPTKLCQVAEKADDLHLRSAVCLGIGGILPNSLTPETRKECARILANWFEHKPDKATHSAAGWALRQWQMPEPRIAASTRPANGFEWHVNSI